MRSVARAVLPVLLVTVALVPAAHADTMYSYVGDYFGTINGQPRVSGVYTTADRITGSFTVAEGFIPGAVVGGASFTGGGFYSDGTQAPAGLSGVVSYSFTDGHQTLNQNNSSIDGRLVLSLPSDGNRGFNLGLWPSDFQPRYWEIHISTPTGSSIGTVIYLDGDRDDAGFLDQNNWGRNGVSTLPGDGSHRGTWTVAKVPEPATILLTAMGLLALGTVGRRGCHARDVAHAPVP